MRALYIYDGDWPRGATRVRKQTRALAKGGFDVLLLSRNQQRQARVDRESWMQVRRLPTFPGETLNRALNFPFFFSPTWLLSIRRTVRDFRPDVIVVEDLPMAPAAIALGHLSDTPVIYDMGEVYPEFLRGLRSFKRLSISDRIIRNPWVAERLEERVLASSDMVFVVSHESRMRALDRGSPPERTIVVGNTPEDPTALTTPREAPPAISYLSRRRIILFVGILISDRGLLQAVEAMDHIRRATSDVTLLIVGDGAERGRVERRVHELDLGGWVTLTGWQAHETLPGYYQHADIGLLPFLDGGQIRYTLANKLFDYMAAGLPVVASDVPPMRRVLRECGGGLLARPGDPDDLARVLLELLALPSTELDRMGTAGQRAVLEKYNWSEDEARMLAAVNQLVGAGT